MRRRRSNEELRNSYTLTVAQLAQLLRTSKRNLYKRFIDEDGHPADHVGDLDRWRDVQLHVEWLGRRCPAHRDQNGHLVFWTREADDAFAFSADRTAVST